MKNLAGSDGSTRWLNVSYQANRSTAGAHHSTVSVVTAGTCWAGPSWLCTGPYILQEGPATHLALVFIACSRYETKRDFAGPPWAVNHDTDRRTNILKSTILSIILPNPGVNHTGDGT